MVRLNARRLLVEQSAIAASLRSGDNAQVPGNNLLFIDANIWLDFYRARNEASLKLLSHAESLIDRIIVTYQLESEFKKNRQSAIVEGLQALKDPVDIPRLGIFSNSKATRVIDQSTKRAKLRVEKLRKRLLTALESPTRYDPVYKACQRLFHKEDEINLTRKNTLRQLIRRRAFKRFLHGCPPRKKNDTSIGDAFNWEWMVHCAEKAGAGLIIVSRDSDYGVTVDGKSYVNDHLRQEFSEKVSRKRKLMLYSKLSEALKLFRVEVTPQEEEAEKELLTTLKTFRELTGTSRSASYLKEWFGSTTNLKSLLESIRTDPQNAD